MIIRTLGRDESAACSLPNNAANKHTLVKRMSRFMLLVLTYTMNRINFTTLMAGASHGNAKIVTMQLNATQVRCANQSRISMEIYIHLEFLKNRSRFVRRLVVLLGLAASLSLPPAVAAQSVDLRAFGQFSRKSESTLNLAGVLFEPVRTGDYKAENFRRAEQLIRHAAALGADLVCTYEQFLDGYGLDANKMQGATDPQATRCEVIGESPYVRRLSELAKELRIAIVAGMAIREGSQTFNSSLIFDPTGSLIGIYRKTHNAGKYARWFAPLTVDQKKAACPSFPMGAGRLSIKICNDRRFPETTEYMVDNGCQLLLCPAFGNYSADQLMEDSRRFGLWAVFVHPEGCQFIDSGNLVLEHRRQPDEPCVVLHTVEFRSPSPQPPSLQPKG